MSRATDGRTCTTVRGCTAAPLYEITATGALRGVPWGAQPKNVHLFACEPHLHLAQQQARNREHREIKLIENQQSSLFDQ